MNLLTRFLTMFLIYITVNQLSAQPKSGSQLFGTKKYSDFEKPEYCGSACHRDFYQQWKQSLMSQSYTHQWNEIEYFKLAVPHAEKDTFFAKEKANCIGCHSPMTFMVGDIPPARPEKNSRANESVSCSVCHSITGFSGDTPFNFNYTIETGRTKFGSRTGLTSPAHESKKLELFNSGDFCGICHNEKDSYGIWVKSTHLEWKASPYFKNGVQCQTCHMPKAESKTAMMGNIYSDANQHLFHGAHDPGKIKGTIELRINPDIRVAEPGEEVKISILLFNQKAGHKFPTGSVEDRIVWMHVDAVDSKGKVFHLPVDKKGFDGEEYTIGSDVLAYQDLGIPLSEPNFKGIQRDGVPIGDRIFRMPYFNPQGGMTIMQWNTKSLGVDYRIGPQETKMETCTFDLPDDIASGNVTVTATLYYQRLIKSVADFLGVSPDESEIIKVNESSTTFTVLE
ncbi:MAG: multiheme c-type cytochrome [Ignavibacteriales bacterium]|nr:multiheme c-type cytochrome [Ignavibacteriales bacterium]